MEEMNVDFNDPGSTPPASGLNYQVVGFTAQVSRRSLPIQSGDFVARSPKPVGKSELFG